MLAEIAPVYQTCKLLQMKKTDVKEITSVCTHLNPLQVRRRGAILRERGKGMREMGKGRRERGRG